MAVPFYAHTKDNEPPDRWQPLEDHLKRVAELARSFADEFRAGDWGYKAGLWYDVRNIRMCFSTRADRRETLSMD